METLIDSLDENLAYKASSFVLEQVNGKARQKIEEVRSVNVFVMPPDKLSMGRRRVVYFCVGRMSRY